MSFMIVGMKYIAIILECLFYVSGRALLEVYSDEVGKHKSMILYSMAVGNPILF